MAKSEFQLQERSLGKAIEDAVANKLKERNTLNGYSHAARLSSRSRLARAGNTLDDNLKKDIDNEIEKYLK